MFVVTPFEMRRIDQRAIEQFGIPGIVLMENAAIKVVEVIQKVYSLKEQDRVVVLVGVGNNGGDGLAVARHLFLRGVGVDVFLLAREDAVSGDAGINLGIVKKLGVPLVFVRDESDISRLKESLKSATLVVDAIFGTGLSRPVEGIFAEVIELVNRVALPVVAVDIPSGINGADGRVMGTAVKAMDTVTFGYPKRGHLLYPGRKYTGKLHVVPIGLPLDSAQAVGVQAFTLDVDEAAGMLKERPAEGHKGTFGRVAVVAGSTGMTGAACLAAMAALRSGAGLVTLGIPASLNDILENKLTEVMTRPLQDHGTGCLQEEALDDVLDLVRDADVLAIGPGLGKSGAVVEVLRNILGRIDISIVLDADGLNHISRDISLLSKHAGPVVITPHPGEMARLTGLSVAQIVESPVEVAQRFSQETGVVVLLKGATTVVCHPDGRVYFNTTGNSGMATAGSGDVLTGIIAGFIAQGYEPFDAAVLGAFVHGYAGDLAADAHGQAGMVAGDILEAVPLALKKMYNLLAEHCKSWSHRI
jgi:NAD(P)H-hydrate epimerase